MDRKECFKCLKTRPITAFYRHPQMTDGHLNKCKECAKSDVRKNRSMNIEYYRAYDRTRGGGRASDEYLNSERYRASCRASSERWSIRNPEKKRSQIALGNAVRDGRVIKPDTCQCCGEGGRIHGHHFDYGKPLEVEWLCPACHAQVHKEMRNLPLMILADREGEK